MYRPLTIEDFPEIVLGSASPVTMDGDAPPQGPPPPPPPPGTPGTPSPPSPKPKGGF